MKFVSIFGDDECLLSVKSDNETLSEFDKIFRNWTDIEYLDAFFTTHKIDLKKSTYNHFFGETQKIYFKKAIRLEDSG